MSAHSQDPTMGVNVANVSYLNSPVFYSALSPSTELEQTPF